MGMDLTLYVADWERLRALPPQERIPALDDAQWPDELDVEEYLDTYRQTDGWAWPPPPEPAWCAEYRFFTTTGAYSTQADAGSSWQDIRPLADASLRTTMDTFLRQLIWHQEPESYEALRDGGGMFPPMTDPHHPPTLLVCPPEAMPAKVRAWATVQPRLDELQGPFSAECEGWAGRPESFESFTALLSEWAEVAATADRYG